MKSDLEKILKAIIAFEEEMASAQVLKAAMILSIIIKDNLMFGLEYKLKTGESSSKAPASLSISRKKT